LPYSVYLSGAKRCALDIDNKATLTYKMKEDVTGFREVAPTRSIFEFMELIWVLKDLERSGWKYHKVSGIMETTASHTFGVMVLTWLFARKEHADEDRALKMALVHDLVESVIGDLTPYDAEVVNKSELEEEGMRAVEAKLPVQLRKEILSLTEEFRAGKSSESEIVRVCDKLDTVFQAYFYRKAKRISEASFKEFFSYAEKVCDKDFSRELLDQIWRAASDKT